MKSSLNVWYNVYAPKVERNRATHLNRMDSLSAQITVQTAARRELTGGDAFTRSCEH